MELIAEVYAERADLRLRLYLQHGVYRIRVKGMGWAPTRWTDRETALAKLLACHSYGLGEADMLRGMCRH